MWRPHTGPFVGVGLVPIPDVHQNRSSNKKIVVAAVSAALASGVVILLLYNLAGPAIAVAITVLPGMALTWYVLRQPTVQNRFALLISLIVGVIAVVVNSLYLSSDSCTTDAMCGLNLINAPVVQLVAFLALRMSFSFARRR